MAEPGGARGRLRGTLALPAIDADPVLEAPAGVQVGEAGRRGDDTLEKSEAVAVEAQPVRRSRSLRIELVEG